MAPKKKKTDVMRQFFIYTLIFLIIAYLFYPSLQEASIKREEVTFTSFLESVKQGEVKEVTVDTRQSLVSSKVGDKQIFTYMMDYPDLVPFMQSKGIDVKVVSPNSNWLSDIFITVFLPFLLFAGLWLFIFRQARGANNQAISFGKSKAKVTGKADKDNEKITFKDVAGIEEALEEVKEIVDFLKSPKKYMDIGAKIPKGVLLVGSPGCGKTLLAKAMAGEASVDFFSISGSDFVEMFVGVGASRVRDLFNQARKQMPAIIFVDEIDAVGRHRGAGLGGGHDEREQTLNQLLVEMDGFDKKTPIIVVAATNRPDILDPALLRPGRFDRQIVIDKPDVKGRQEILKIHTKGIKRTDDIELEVIARRTPGFTGADLANLVNEAALLAARNNKKKVNMKDMEAAIDRVIAGPEKKSKIMSDKEKEIIAYHELGHAVVAKALPDADPVHKISILPRGMALGYTLQLPLEDKYLVSRKELTNDLAILLGGRAAEEIFFGEITTGASNDIERATGIAHKMVCEYGMSPLGNRIFGQKSSNVFLGRDFANHEKDYSDETSKMIDDEINKLVADAYKFAKKTLSSQKTKIKKIAAILLEKEVLEAEEFSKLIG